MPGEAVAAVSATDRLQAFVRGVDQIPALPDMAQGLLRGPHPSKGRMQTLVQILTGDPEITSRVLRIVNSGGLSFRGEVCSLHHAVSLVGLETVRQLCVGASVIRLFSNGRSPSMDVAPWLWKHAVAVGLISRKVAGRINLSNSELMFTAGLLHDIGRVLLFEYAPAEVQHAAAKAEKKRISLLEAEQMVFGFDHRHLGEWIATQWKLPRIFKLAILRHHDPHSYAWESEAERRAISVVALADEAAHFRGLSFFRAQPTFDVPDTLRYLKLEGNDVTELTENLVEETDAFYQSLRAAPDRENLPRR